MYPALIHDTKALAFWTLKSTDLRTKAGRLCDAGWQGLTACSISRKERQIINEYLKTLRRPDFCMMHCVTFDDGDLRIGAYRQNQICVWFRKEAAFEDCFKVLRSIPERSVEFVVPRMTTTLTKLLKPLNHRLIRGSDGTLLVSVVATLETLEIAREYDQDG